MAGGRHRTAIVGAGQAGAWTAITLRELDGKREIVLLGEEAHPPYERPPVSKDVLAGKIGIESAYVRPHGFYAEQGIDLRLGTKVTAVDRGRRTVTVETSSFAGYELSYDDLVLATGARPRTLAGCEAATGRIFYLRAAEDAERLRARLLPGVKLAVIGAGFIGLEVAATASAAGASVTVIDTAPHALARVADRSVAELLTARHEAAGVAFRFGTSVEAVEAYGLGFWLHLTDGETIGADLAVVGIGAIPNTDLAATAGLPVEDGIVVDAFGRTADERIFAVGDATRHFNPLLGRSLRLESWQNAQNQAIAVARVMAGGVEPYAEVPWFWTDQYDWNLQLAGAPVNWDQVVWRGDPALPRATVFYLSGGRVVAGNTINNGRDMRFVKRLIETGEAVDPAALSDPKVPLARIAA